MKTHSDIFPDYFPESWAESYGQDEFGIWQGVYVEDIEIRFRWIPPGEFMMGSPDKEPERYDHEGPQHRVKIEQGYWLAETACAQVLWQAVMKDNPSNFKESTENPVENIDWEIAQEFIQTLNQINPEFDFRLPSEAEWEYACRAGTTTPFSFGSELTTEGANYDGNNPYNNGKKGEYRKKTAPVKSLKASPWGLYQMHGNVWEWCEDRWHDSYKGGDRPDDGSAWKTGSSEYYVCRGGSWARRGWNLRSASRHFDFIAPGSIGFRLARGSESSSTASSRADAAVRQLERGTSDAASLLRESINGANSSLAASVNSDDSEEQSDFEADKNQYEEKNALFPWEEYTQNALSKAMENAVWNEESKTMTIEYSDDPRLFYELKSWEELTQALNEIASTAFFANAPRDDGDFTFNNYEEFVEAILDEYGDQLEEFFDE